MRTSPTPALALSALSSSAPSFLSSLASSIALCLPLAACGSDRDATFLSAGAAPVVEVPAEPGPVYALSSLVWGDVETTGYVTLTNTLDPAADLTLEDAREFPGYVTIASADGNLFVTTADTPVIRRFGVSEALTWEERGELSLINEGVLEGGFSRQYMRRDQVVYAEVDSAQHALWDPVGFEVLGSRFETQLPLARDGLDLFAAFNRNYFVFDGPVMRPFSYHDQDWFRWAADSQIVVYDPDTHAERAVLDAPCPGLDTITRDESGNLYFSNWEYSSLHVLTGTGAAACVVRVNPEGNLDPEWDPDLTQLTAGRQVMNFRYLRDGKALAAVLHAEYFGADFDFASELATQDAFWDAYALNYRLWLFDLSAGTAEPVRGLPDGDVSPSYAHSEIDGRIFLLLEATDYSSATVYELSADGAATRRFSVPGSSYQWLRVR